MDDKDVLILQLLNDDPGLSLNELREAIQANSITTAYNRVQNLTEKKLIEETPPGTPRRRKLTPSGIVYLSDRHLIYHDPRET